MRISFFSSTSGAVEAGTTTQPMRIFTGAAWARARPATGRERRARRHCRQGRIDDDRCHCFMAIPPRLSAPFCLGAYQLRPRRAIDRRQPKSGPQRGIESGEGPMFRSPARRHPDALARHFGPCGVGNGNDFKRPTARSIHLRRRAVEAGPVRRHAVGSRYPLAHHAQHPAQYPDRRFGHGYRDRSAYGDRHGAGRRHRRHAPQSRTRRAGGAGAPGEEIRIRHGGEPGHHPSRRDARRCAGADAGASHFRHSGGRRRRQRPTNPASWSASSPTATCASPPTSGKKSPS